MKFRPFVLLTIISITAIIISGCSKIIPIEQMTMQKAEEAYENKNYDEALRLYLELLEKQPKEEYVIRAHYRCAEIYKAQENWDEAIVHYQEVRELNPTGYLGSMAKSGIADIPKYRKIINDNDYIYENIFRDDEGKPLNQEEYKKGADALFQIARAYESMGLFKKAVEYYSKVMDEFPEYERAAQAGYKCGNIYFYKLYDYQQGWPYYIKVIEKYPDSYEAKEADRLLKETKRTLDTLDQDMEHVRQYTNKKALEYEARGRRVDQDDKYKFTDQIAQDYVNIAKGWLDLKNYPNAIAAYKELANELSMEKFEAAEARYQVGLLYQEDGQYEKAIEAYNELFEKNPESTRRNIATYNQAVCYQAINEFEKAYEGFKTYLGFPKEDVDEDLFREAKQKIRQMEMDEDGDGFMFYQEQAANTSDQDPNQHP